MAKYTRLFGLFILVLALLVRLPLLDHSFWLDEAAQALESSRPTSEQLQLTPDFQPPLLHLVLHAAMKLGLPTTEVALRFVGAVLPGLITVLAIMILGTRRWSAQVGLTAGLLLAVNPFHYFYSQELRPYSLPTMWAALSWLVVLWTQKSSLSNKQWVTWVVVSLAGWYSSYLYPFFWVGQVMYLLWFNRTQWRTLVISCAAVGLLFAPWLPALQLQLDAGGEVRENLKGWAEVVGTPPLKALPLVGLKFVFGQLDVSASPFFLGSLACLGLIAVSLVVLTWRRWRQQELGLFFAWVFIPLATSWLFTWYIPVLQPKRVLFILPGLLLLFALASLKVRSTAIKTACLVFFLGIQLASLGLFLKTPAVQREPWRPVIEQVESMYAGQKAVAVFAFDEPFAPWRWYQQQGSGTMPSLSLGTLTVTDTLDTTLLPVLEYPVVIVFDYLRDLSDPGHQIEAFLLTHGYTPGAVIDGYSLGFVRVYTQPSAIHLYATRRN